MRIFLIYSIRQRVECLCCDSYKSIFAVFTEPRKQQCPVQQYESVEGQLRRIVTLKFQDSAKYTAHKTTTKRNSNRRGSCTVYNV